MDRPLQIRIRPSHVAQYYCFIVALLSLSAILLADLPWLVQILLCVMVVVYVWRTVQSIKSTQARVLEGRNGHWYLHCVNDMSQMELEQHFFLGAGIIILPFRLQSGQCWRLVLWPDSADKDDLRRLRAALLAS